MSRGRSRPTPPGWRRPDCEQIIGDFGHNGAPSSSDRHSRPPQVAGAYAAPGRYWHATRAMTGMSYSALIDSAREIRGVKPDFEGTNLKLLSRATLYGMLQDAGVVRLDDVTQRQAAVDKLELGKVSARIKTVEIDLRTKPTARYWRITAAISDVLTPDREPHSLVDEQHTLLGALGLTEGSVPDTLSPPRLMLGIVPAAQNFTPALRRLAGEALEGLNVAFEPPTIRFN